MTVSPFQRFVDALNQKPGWALTGIMMLALLLRMIDIEKTSLWIDEAYSFLVANGHPYPCKLHPFVEPVQTFYQHYLAWQPLSYGQLITILKQNVHMPLYYLLLNPWLQLAGNTAWGLRTFSTIFSCLLILPVYGLTSRMSDHKAGLWAAFFCAVVPFQLFYGQEGRMYSLSMFWAASAAWAFWHFLFASERLRWSIIYSLTILFGFFIHYMFLLYLSFHAVIGLITVVRRKDYSLLVWGMVPLLVLGICGAYWYPIYQIQQQGVWDNYHFAKGHLDLIRYINKFFLMPMEALANNNIFARVFYFPLAVFLILASGYKLWRKEGTFRLSHEGFLIAWMFVPILLQCLYDWTHNTHTTIITRYLVLVTPAMQVWCGMTVANGVPSRLILPPILTLPLKGGVDSQVAPIPNWPMSVMNTSGIRLVRPNPFNIGLVIVMLGLAFASVLHASPLNLHTNKKEISRAAAYLCQHLEPHDLVFTNGPLGAPNLLVYYLNDCAPQQPMIYWVKDYANQPTPLPTVKTMTRYRRIWFFSNRSNKSRGQEMAKAYIRTTHPVQLEHIDPEKQLHLFVLESDRERYDNSKFKSANPKS